MRKWKSDLFRATLGLEAAAAADPAGTQCAIMKEQEKYNTTDCCLVSTSTQSQTIHDTQVFTLCTLNLMYRTVLYSLLPFSHTHSHTHTHTHTQLPKHLRPEAESWKPSGHKQVKLPSVLEQVPNVQISADWEHSSISDTKRGTASTFSSNL